jgi:predicted 3-demethylubiquinone-9 3-methyltransferase (glyoxalase superfamily)
MSTLNTQQIVPFLWFDNNAEEAVTLYTSLFENSRITGMARYGKEGPGPEGRVMTISFELNGTAFSAINGGPHFKFTEAISFVINCNTQQEVDHYWTSLLEGGSASQCGWLKDKFGLSWQIVPTILPKLLQSGEPIKSGRMMKAMMKMVKLDIKELQDAYNGE